MKGVKKDFLNNFVLSSKAKKGLLKNDFCIRFF